MIISCDAVITYARRYAKLAREMAAECKDAARRAELLQIGENCEKVPAKGAESFMRHASPSGSCSSFYR